MISQVDPDSGTSTVDLDAALLVLLDEYDAARTRNASRLAAVYEKFDANGDGRREPRRGR